MNDRNKPDSWIHIEPFNEHHSWKQTWFVLGGAFMVFALALLYDIDKDMRCKPDQASVNSLTHTSPDTSKHTNTAIALVSQLK